MDIKTKEKNLIRKNIKIKKIDKLYFVCYNWLGKNI